MDAVIVLATLIRPDYVDVATLSRLFCVSRRLDVALVRPRSLKITGPYSHRLYSHRKDELPALLLARYVHTLNLEQGSVRDVSALSNVHTLLLSGTFVDDLSPLIDVHTLDLTFTDVVRVSMLSGVNTLILRETRVTDVSALGRVHTLDLSHTNVSDVSALGGVHTLDLWQTLVTDASALDRVVHLTMPNGDTLCCGAPTEERPIVMV